MKLHLLGISFLFLVVSTPICFGGKNKNNKNKQKNDKKYEYIQNNNEHNNAIVLEEALVKARALIDVYCHANSPVSVGEIRKSIAKICKEYPEVKVSCHQSNGGHTTFGRENNGKGVLITGHGNSATHQPWIANKILLEVIAEVSGISCDLLTMNNPIKNNKKNKNG